MEAREAWFEGQVDLDPERVVFLDETATATNMERRYGRASGPFAVHFMDGATNGARFLSYVTDMLVPALTPGDTVVMDNLAAHKAARTVPDLWAAIRDAFTRFKPNECRNCLAAAGYDAYDPA